MLVRKKIDRVEFGLFSPEMIRRLSAVKIFTPNTYDEDGYPIEGGLMDPRLGVIDPGIRCKTCGGRLGECQGHFGHIELTRPVVHVGYAKEIYWLLKAICKKCSKILISEEELKKIDLTDSIYGEAIWNKSIKVCDSQGKCPHCGEKQIKVKFVRPYSYYEGENSMLVTTIREKFEKITNEDLKLLGLKIRPEWMILSCIPVLPIIARPSITLESADRSEDDLTHKLVDILRINQRLEENINSGAPQLIIEDLWDLLQYHVATYFDNGITGIPPARHRSGRPLKTIAQRLKGKEGRFRNNLSGKRVNFSARTVIGPDPNIGINEVAIPQLIAQELTIPEEVNERNIKMLKKLILNGPNKHPGAHNVITSYGRKRIMEENKKEIAKNLAEGDIVERTIMDKDLVIFNRQPSLHRISMMCHEVKVLPYKTLRLNTAVCAPYNADFDGDEMNLHVPQSEEAIAEGETLMKVQECIISPRFGKPIIGGRHDHVTGTYLLTKKESEFNRAETLEFVQNLFDLPEKKKKFSGKEIFSLLLPKDFSIEYKGKLCKKHDKCKKEKCEEEAYVLIKNGNLISGIIDSEGMSGILLNELFVRYGSDVTREFIDKSTKLAIRVLMRYGFTIGIDEEDLSKEAKNKIKKIIDYREKNVNEIIEEFRKGRLRPIPGKSQEESLEDYIMLELSKARSESGKIAEKFVGKNSSVIMAKTGARGSLLNLTQMAASVGQQAVRGKRIKRGYFSRTLSHFKKGDVSAEANGFVVSNFKEGLSLTEYFFHAMGGRESLVDTAIRTGRSGYMQRRLINALQDLMVYPDLSVRASSSVIVQFKYGEDGIDPMKKGHLSNDVKKALVVPGEAVGTVAAQSIGEPGTQMSIPYNEKVIVKINGQIKIKPIGEFVDRLMNQYHVKKFNGTEICDLPSDVQIAVPSLNEKGRVKWKRLLSCSRHYYSKKLIHIKTRSGREIIATDNHSFVIRKDNQIIPILGKELKLKDRIPVIKNLPLDNPIKLLEISDYLPKGEWWYGSELKKALSMKNMVGEFSPYTIPVGPDQLRNYMKGKNTFEILDGFVYPYQSHSKGKVPEQFKLDSILGWFLGAYLSEGSTSKYSVNISNTDEGFLSQTRKFADALSLNYKEEDNYRGFAKGHDLKISSRVLVEFLEKTCGKGSKGKKIPEFTYSADEAFIGSLLKGYFDGDGNISLERKVIRASSNSKELIDGIVLLLSRLGIFARKSIHNGQYWLSISYRYAKEFKEKIGFDTPEKAKRLDKLCQVKPKKNSYNMVEMIPGIGQLFKKLAKKIGLPTMLVNNFTKRQKIGIMTLKKYTILFEKMAKERGINISKELALLYQMLREDVVWDEIVEIKYNSSENERVYDFSVKGLETFTTSEGIITHNTLRTFHYAGVAELAVPLGLPRLIEIIDAKKSPKNPLMTIFLNEKYSKDERAVSEIADSLQEKFFRDVAKIDINIEKKEIKIESKNSEAKLLLKKISEKSGSKFVIKEKSLANLKRLINKLEKKRISGIKGIKRVYVRKLGEEFVIYTEGSNLKSVLNIKGVDKERTRTNDIHQVYETLGIEAARNTIINEAMNVLKEQKLNVDVRHIMLVADRMCVSGELQSVGRTGISGEKESVLARAAFEETEKHILNAALYGEVDYLKGVAENIIIGQPIPIGTGTVELEVKSELLGGLGGKQKKR